MKNLLFKSALLVILCTGIAFGQGYLVNAQKALKKKEIKVAFGLAKEAFAKDSVNAAFVILLTMKEQKNDAELLDLLAKVYAKQGIAENAIMYYREADKLDSLNIERKFNLAEIFIKDKLWNEAVAEFLKIERIDPKNAKALSTISSIYFNAEMWSFAAVYYEKLLKIDNKLENYLKCVQSADKAKDFNKALDIAKEGLKLTPDNEVLARIGYYSGIKTKRYEEALNCVMVIPDGKLSAEEAKTAGDIAKVLKKEDLVSKYYDLAIAKNPDNKDLYVTMADKAYNDQNFDKAVEYYDKKLALDPKHEHSLLFRAYSHMQKKDWENTRKSFMEWSAVNDTSVLAYYDYANVYDKGKVDSLSRKFEIFNKVLKMIEGKEKQYKKIAVAINYSFVLRYYDAKNWTATIPYLKKVMIYNGEEVDFLIMIAACYENLKEYDTAIDYYRRGKKISPKNEMIIKALRRLSAD